MVIITRTDSDNKDFRTLVSQLDAYLRILDGEDHAFYAQFNKLDKIKQTVVAYKDGVPVGIGAIREFGQDSTEVKRMFVLPEYRRQGVAEAVLADLESWAHELGFASCILETGKRNSEAVNLYLKAGYTIIPNFGQYENDENSVCMRKMLEVVAS